MISFAQNLEDVVLARVFASQKDGIYVDIGAWDPDLDSVTKHFYLRGWSGINVEPSATAFARLSAARPRDVNLNVAVGLGEKPTAAFLEAEGTGLSRLAHLGDAPLRAAGFTARQVEVPVVPLTTILKDLRWKRIDFLKIDVEGAERDVIVSGDWGAFRPRVLVIEAIAPVTHQPAWEEWEDLLLDAGYVFAMFDGINRFYYRGEEPALAAPLSAPANILDGYTTARQQALEDKLRMLQGRSP